MGVLEAAAGIRRIVDMRMADEVRVFAAKRGVDLYGLHAAAVRRRRRRARGRGRRRTRHAAHPGAAAAGRVLGARPALHRRGARLHPLRTQAAGRRSRADHAEAIFAASKRRRASDLRTRAWLPADASFSRELDLRYAGQGYELRTPLDGLLAGAGDGRDARARAARASTSAMRKSTAMPPRTGRSSRELSPAPARARCRNTRRATQQSSVAAARAAASARKGERDVHFDGAQARSQRRFTSATGSIPAHDSRPARAIVEQFDATTVIPPGWRATRRSPPQPDPVAKPGGREDGAVDAVTIEILRNKIASLVEEMHYHFYRSGYSTIIRESRDFSCVILDRDGRLIVAPPMFFHAPVYRHLVGAHPRALRRRRRTTTSATATCSSPTIPMKAACPMSPTWRSWRRSLPAAGSSPSPARSPTRPMSAARSRARPPPMPPKCSRRAC